VITKELAGCVIYNDKGELLVLHRNTPHLTQWELPGGKIRQGESAENSAVRELREELSIKVKILRYLGGAEFVQNNIKWNYNWLEAEIVNGEPSIGEPDIFDNFSYFSIKELTKMNDISPNLVNLLKVI
jgi:8-oxo-dGTP diphosphatase